MKYQLTLDFLDLEHLQEYFQDMKDFEAYKLKKQLKKEVMNALMNHHQILNHIFIIYIIQH